MSFGGKERTINDKNGHHLHWLVNIQEAYSMEEEIAWVYRAAVNSMITNRQATKGLQVSAGRNCSQCVWQGDEGLCQGQAVLSGRHQKVWL